MSYFAHSRTHEPHKAPSRPREIEDPMSQQAALLDINQIGNLMADQPEKTKDSPATVQDLRNMGIAIDANFIVIRSEAKTESALLRTETATGFAKGESEFKSVRSEAKLESALLRSEMATGFSTICDDFAKLRTAAAYSLAVLLLTIIAIGISLGGLIIGQS